MKKILLVLTLTLAVFLSGCGGGGTGTGIGSCSLHGPPNVSYTVLYPHGSASFGNTGPFGSFFVSSRGFSCITLRVRFGFNLNLTLAASPSSVFLPSPPATGTITGQSFETTYGMPMVEYFDGNGYLVGAVYANSVSGDGTSLQANMPNLSYVYSGTYQVKVTNKTYDGYYLNVVGSATMTGWGRDRPDSDGDGWYDDEDCAPYDPYLYDNCNQVCGGGNEPIYLCAPF